jgi:protein arginine kinase activator
MLCQKCHKNLATVRYAEVVDGRVSDQHLCFECMATHQKNATPGFELAGPPSAPKPAEGGVARDVVRAQRACPACGTRLGRILESGGVGCPACYESFAEDVDQVLKGLHRATTHKGRVPRVDDARSRVRAELQAKRILLRSVLRAEQYEQAAGLRDDIRTLEASLAATEAETT